MTDTNQHGRAMRMGEFSTHLVRLTCGYSDYLDRPDGGMRACDRYDLLVADRRKLVNALRLIGQLDDFGTVKLIAGEVLGG